MPTGLQPPQECTDNCNAVTTAVPGPAGADGAAGAAGTNGTNSYTALTAEFTMPAAQSSVSTAARAANVATIVTQAAHNLVTGDVVDITGIVTAAFNDTDQTVTVTNGTTFTYANTGANIGATPETAGRVDPESDATVTDASWLPVGGTPTSFPIVFLQNCGYLELMGAVGNTLTLRNTGWAGNIAAAATVATSNKLGMGGPVGVDGEDGSGGADADAYYLVTESTDAPTNAFDLGGLNSGILKHTQAAGVSTPAMAIADTDYLAVDAGLLDLAGVAMAANEFYYTTADNVHASASVTATALSLLDDANEAAMRATLQLGTAAVENVATFLQAANNLSDVADAATARTNLGVSASGDALLVANDLSDLNDADTARTSIGLQYVAKDQIVLRVEKADGVAGGAATSGSWEDIVLNTEGADTGNHCSLNAGTGEFTLLAGTYRIRAFSVGHEVDEHQCRLRNTTDAATTLLGTTSQAGDTDHTSSDSIIIGRFTIASSKAFKLQHQVTTSQALDGYGAPASFGEGEVYATVELEREAG